MIGKLNEDQVNNILQSEAMGRLACTDGLQPYIVPVNYAYDGKYIYGQTNEGAKLKMLRKNPNVCFEVDRKTDFRNWQSVIVFGQFEELKKKEMEKAREILFHSIFPLMTGSTIHPFQHGVNTEVDDSTRIKDVMYRIRIQKITGRFEKDSIAPGYRMNSRTVLQ